MDTIKIRNNDPRLILLPPVPAGPESRSWGAFMLEPGVNHVPVEYWRLLVEGANGVPARQDVLNMLKEVAQTRPDSPMIEHVLSGTALIPKNVKESLGDLSPQNAIELVKDATEAQLATWAAKEKRGEVKKAIKDRLEELRNGKAPRE